MGITWQEWAAILSVATALLVAITWLLKTFIRPIIQHEVASIQLEIVAMKREMKDEFTVLEKNFVTKEMLDVLLRQADQTHSRYDQQFHSVWAEVNKLRDRILNEERRD